MTSKNTLTQHILNVIFNNPKDLLNNQLLQNKMIERKKDLGIRVQSVALPIDYDAYNLKTKEEVLNWLQYKIQNVHTAFHKINENDIHWSNNNMLNHRYLQTKKMYGFTN